MDNFNLSFKEINELIEKLNDEKLGEIYIKNGDFEIKIKAKETTVAVAASTPVIASPVSVLPREDNLEQVFEELDNGRVIKSPIVGTFYSQAAPDKPPFVAVGSKISKGDVLFVIESMKLMNEVQSEVDGEVAEVLVKNGQGVEYGQPIIRIK